MAHRPFALWRPLKYGEQPAGASHFPGYEVLNEFALFYTAAANRGISATMLDGMELWQVGAALGMISDEQGAQAQDPVSLLPKEYLEERAKAIAEGRPLPDPPLIQPRGRPPSTNDLFQQVPQVVRR